MEILEFHFNPKGKRDLIFDSFCYEPENVYEKRMGSLYMVGVLKNALPQNLRFLDTLARIIREKYYKTVSPNPEKALREALRKANEHLEKTARAGDVSWLGNLHFSVSAFKNSEVNFTKVGDLKIFLLRKGHIVDIDQKLQGIGEIEPYPLKVFGNIITGKLAENDVVLILTKEIADFFTSQALTRQIARLSPFNKKRLQETLNGKKEDLSKISGLCLLIYLSKEPYRKEKETLLPKKTFKIKNVFAPLLSLLKLPKFSLPKKPAFSIKKPSISIKKLKIKFPSLKFGFSLPWQGVLKNKKLSPIIFLIVFLALGAFIFSKTEEKRLEAYWEEVKQIQEKMNQAETYLLLAEKNPQAKTQANLLFSQSWQELTPLVNMSSSFPRTLSEQISSLKNNLASRLFELNQLVEIEEPELFFEFQARGFIPQRLVSFRDDLYLFSPYAENVFQIDKEKQGKVLEITEKINFGIALADSVLLLAKPNKLIGLADGQFQNTFSLQTPSVFDWNAASVFQSNLYLLDIKQAKIVKYPYLSNFLWGNPLSWYSNQKARDFRSLAVDGSVWILTKDNSIERYYAGTLQEMLSLQIFPEPKYFSKLFTSGELPYLYLLEPSQKRIVVLDKQGLIVKQFQSPKFDGLLDFTVSQDGKIIYLLNGLKVYKILF